MSAYHISSLIHLSCPSLQQRHLLHTSALRHCSGAPRWTRLAASLRASLLPQKRLRDVDLVTMVVRPGGKSPGCVPVVTHPQVAVVILIGKSSCWGDPRISNCSRMGIPVYPYIGPQTMPHGLSFVGDQHLGGTVSGTKPHKLCMIVGYHPLKPVCMVNFYIPDCFWLAVSNSNYCWLGTAAMLTSVAWKRGLATIVGRKWPLATIYWQEIAIKKWLTILHQWLMASIGHFKPFLMD